MNINLEFLEYLMSESLKEARKAVELDEVPVGCVIARDNQIISRAHNLVNQNNDSSCHAEILALQSASKLVGDWRLEQCLLCVTLEPCTMCIGAIRNARIPVIVFGAHDERLGACGSIYDISLDSRLGPVPRVISGIQAKDSVDLLQAFFKSKRSK